MSIFRKPGGHRPKPVRLTDARVRPILRGMTPVTDLNGVSYRWFFVRETRTASGTLGFVYRDPFNPQNEQVWVVDFNTGATRNIGPARPVSQPPIKALPPVRQPLLLPPPDQAARNRKKFAQRLGEAFLKGITGRMH